MTKYFAIGTKNLFISQAHRGPLESKMEDEWLGLDPISSYYWSDLGRELKPRNMNENIFQSL